jgi:hypothetical protein
MRQFLVLFVFVLSITAPAYGQIRGTVESLSGRFFIMDADGVTMKIFGDSNTRFKIGNIFVSAGYVVKNTEVSVSGTTDRVGEMHAVLVTIFPSKETVSGTVKSMKSGEFILETAKGDLLKVTIAKFTKFMEGKRPGSRGKKTDSSKIKVGTKIGVNPITSNPDSVDAWEISVQSDE